ncbi:MAG: 2Fe-2S iron-sulfur cluster-binding protein [Treponema sp.]|nr:2Fe-2S iron-sulfur cluster-binding protein [Treponema sp.]
MTINFILNGEDVSIDCLGETRLSELLRRDFKLLGIKTGCYAGACGACSIILNGSVVKSCLIPAFKIEACEVITIEGFSQTEEYQDIIQGFKEGSCTSCGFCDNGKILTTEALISKVQRPSRDQILGAFQGIKCRCTDPEDLIRGVQGAMEVRRRRTHGRP